jgi:hypothetical protein
MGDKFFVRVDIKIEGHGCMWRDQYVTKRGNAYTRTERRNIQGWMQNVEEQQRKLCR